MLIYVCSHNSYNKCQDLNKHPSSSKGIYLQVEGIFSVTRGYELLSSCFKFLYILPVALTYVRAGSREDESLISNL